MNHQHFDVIIAGAGLAACSTAMVLRQAGFSVAMFDEVPVGAVKIGEALPGAAKRLLLRLGIGDLSGILPSTAFRPCLANVSAWKSEHWTYKDAIMNPEGGGWHLCRDQFDAAIRQFALQKGVVYFPSKIAQVTQTPDAADFSILLKKNMDNGINHFKSTWIIDATGRSSYICKNFFKVKKTVYSAQMAAVAWLKCSATDDADQTTRIKSIDDNGWYYTARLPNATRVIAAFGTVERIANFRRAPASLIEAFNRCQLLPDVLQTSDLLYAPKVADASVTKLEQVAGKNWFAVGDAALSFDPLSSQGMFFALYSGIQAAETILKCTANPDKNNPLINHYQLLVNNVFEAQQRARAYFYTQV
jgi:flavin-dependent dehydrogenase